MISNQKRDNDSRDFEPIEGGLDLSDFESLEFSVFFGSKQ